MEKLNEMLSSKPKVINAGLESFNNDLKSQSVESLQVDWKPPAGGDPEIIGLFDKINNNKELLEKIVEANNEAVERLMNSQGILVDIKQAKDIIPGLEDKMILHAGPPVKWENMCGPVQGAITGALVYEGWADNIDEAYKLAESGEIKFDPCHHHNTVGPMAGIVSPSMYVFCVKNKKYGNTAYCTLNEGLGKVLRFGANGEDVIEKLKWMEKVLAPVLKKAVKLAVDDKGGIDIKQIIMQALQMGDECHNRNVAGTSLFIRAILPYLLSVDEEVSTIKKVLDFIMGNDHFFLNLSMPACKCAADTIKGLEYSTIMCAMARNGTEIGIRIAGTGDEWFANSVGMPEGLYFAGYSEKDSCGDLGDSTITETGAIGGAAMAAAPAIVKFVGGKPADAFKATKEMYQITWTKNQDYQIPNLDFQGTPTGIDLMKILDTGILPFINTGIAHKKAGIGQIGAGLLRANPKCFTDALKSFVKKYC